MLVLVTYDVSTIEESGKRRLRQVARACQDWGQRVQMSVFEIEVDPAQWARLRARLEGIIRPEHNSLRHYFLGAKGRGLVEHVGAKPATDLGGALIV